MEKVIKINHIAVNYRTADETIDKSAKNTRIHGPCHGFQDPVKMRGEEQISRKVSRISRSRKIGGSSNY